MRKKGSAIILSLFSVVLILCVWAANLYASDRAKDKAGQQVEKVLEAVMAKLKETCPGWSDEQVNQYVQGIKEAVVSLFKAPVSEEELKQIISDICGNLPIYRADENWIKWMKNEFPADEFPSLQQFARHPTPGKAELEHLIASMKWHLSDYQKRPPLTAETAKKLQAQINEMAERALKELKAAFPDLKSEIIQAEVETFKKKCIESMRNRFALTFKKELLEDTKSQIFERLTKEVAEESKRFNESPTYPAGSDEVKKSRARVHIQKILGWLRGEMVSVTFASPATEIPSNLTELGKRAAQERQEESARFQQEWDNATRVKQLLGRYLFTLEGREETIFILTQIFNLINLLNSNPFVMH